MPKKKLIELVPIVTFSWIMVSTLYIPPVVAGTPFLGIYPLHSFFDESTVWLGHAFNEDIVINDVDEALGLTGASFTLTYNATVIGIVGGNANVTMDLLWTTFAVTVSENLDPATLDTVNISVSDPASNPSGNVHVATIRFTVMTQAGNPPTPSSDVDYSFLEFSNVFLYHDASEVPAGTSLLGFVIVEPVLGGPIFEVSVVEVAFSKTVIGQGYCLLINTTVANFGAFAATVNITVSANDTVLEIAMGITLPGCQDYEACFIMIWNTTDFARGNYTINAEVSEIPGEVFTWDNFLVGGSICISIPGDVDADKIVDLKDVYAVCKAYGSLIGDSRYNPDLDINDDGRIDLKDYCVPTTNFGKGW
ncbi:hypothetical protein KEJ15_07075 [Candidatus Bathyarchaeota archaeon]|nr:hypothetical protein [Candidatus Bathyarchaeota archaeon]